MALFSNWDNWAGHPVRLGEKSNQKRYNLKAHVPPQIFACNQPQPAPVRMQNIEVEQVPKGYFFLVPFLPKSQSLPHGAGSTDEIVDEKEAPKRLLQLRDLHEYSARHYGAEVAGIFKVKTFVVNPALFPN